MSLLQLSISQSVLSLLVKQFPLSKANLVVWPQVTYTSECHFFGHQSVNVQVDSATPPSM